MQFQMPRFLDIEDKVIGPLTFKQFVYLGGGIGLAYIAYTYLGWGFGFLFIAIFLGLGIGLSFWKPNKRPFIVMLLAFLTHYSKKRYYKWERPTKAERLEKINNTKKDEIAIHVNKPFDHKKIESLAWSLDTSNKE